MTSVGSIRRQAKKMNLVSRAAELSVIFTKVRQVLTNVPTGSTPFLFRTCRTILGNKSTFLRYSWHAAAYYWPPLSRLRWQGDVAGNSVSKSSVSILREGALAGRGAGSGGECANWFAVRRMPMYGPGATAGIPAFPEWHTASHQVQPRINAASY